MDKIKISKYQFFLILWSYIVCNDLVRGYYANELRMDLMIVVPVGMFLSVIVYFLYSFIYKNNHYHDFTTSIENITGKFISKVLFIIYPIYFILIVFINIRDISELIQRIFIEDALIFMIGLGFLLILIYIVFHGLEVFARYSTYVFAVGILSFIPFSLSLFFFNEFKVNNVLPLFEQGYQRLIMPSLRQSFGVPFGELFVMLILFQFVTDRKKSYKWGYFGIIFPGLILFLLTFYNLIFLGAEAMTVGFSPALRVMRRVEVKNLLQRLDLLVLCFFMLFITIKTGALLLGTNVLLSKVIKIKKEVILTIIFCFMMLIGLIFFTKKYSDFILFRFNVVIPYINLTFEIIIPFLLIIISFFRKPKKEDYAS